MCASVHVECQQTTLAWGRFSCALLCMLIYLTLELLGFCCLCSSHCGGARITDVLQQLPSWGLNSDSYAFLRSSFRTEPISLAPPKPVYFDGQRLPAVPPMNFSVFPEETNTWRGSVIYPSHKSTDVETADSVCNFLYIGLAWDFSLHWKGLSGFECVLRMNFTHSWCLMIGLNSVFPVPRSFLWEWW